MKQSTKNMLAAAGLGTAFFISGLDDGPEQPQSPGKDSFFVVDANGDPLDEGVAAQMFCSEGAQGVDSCKESPEIRALRQAIEAMEKKAAACPVAGEVPTQAEMDCILNFNDAPPETDNGILKEK